MYACLSLVFFTHRMSVLRVPFCQDISPSPPGPAPSQSQTAAAPVSSVAPTQSVVAATATAPMEDVSLAGDDDEVSEVARPSPSAAARGGRGGRRRGSGRASAAQAPPSPTSSVGAAAGSKRKTRGSARGVADAAAAAAAPVGSDVEAKSSAQTRKKQRPTAAAAPAAAAAASSSAAVVLSPSQLVALRGAPSAEVVDLRHHKDVLLLGPELSLLRPSAAAAAPSGAGSASSVAVASSSSSLAPVGALFTGDGRAFSGFLVSTDEVNEAPNVYVLMHGELVGHADALESDAAATAAAAAVTGAASGSNKKSVKKKGKKKKSDADSPEAPLSADPAVVARCPPVAVPLDTVAYPSAFRALLQCYLALQNTGVAIKSLCCVCCGHAQYSQVACVLDTCSFTACSWCAAQYFGGQVKFPEHDFKTVAHEQHRTLAHSISGRYMYRPIPTLVIALLGYQFDDFLQLFETDLVNSGCAPCGYGVFWEIRCFSTLPQLHAAVEYFCSRVGEYAGIEQVLVIMPLHQDVIQRLLVTESFTVQQQHVAAPEAFPLLERDEKTPSAWRDGLADDDDAPGSERTAFSFHDAGAALRPLFAAFAQLQAPHRPVVYMDLVTCQVTYEHLSAFGIASGLRDELYAGLASYLQPCPLAMFAARMRQVMPVWTCHDPAPVLQVRSASDADSLSQQAAAAADVSSPSPPPAAAASAAPAASSSAFVRRLPYDRVVCMAQSAIAQINLRTVYFTPAKNIAADLAAAHAAAAAAAGQGSSSVPPPSAGSKDLLLTVPTAKQLFRLNLKGHHIAERCGFRAKLLGTLDESQMKALLKASPLPPIAAPSVSPAPASSPRSSSTPTAAASAKKPSSAAAPAAVAAVHPASLPQFDPLPTDDPVTVGMLRVAFQLQRDIDSRRAARSSAASGVSAQQPIDLSASSSPLSPIPSIATTTVALQSFPMDNLQIRQWQGRIGQFVTLIGLLRGPNPQGAAAFFPPPPPPPAPHGGPGSGSLPPFGSGGAGEGQGPSGPSALQFGGPAGGFGSAPRGRSAPGASACAVSGGGAPVAPLVTAGASGSSRFARMPVCVPPAPSFPLPPSTGESPHRGSLPSSFEPPVFPLVMPHIRQLMEREELLPVGLRRWRNEWQCMEYFCHRASQQPSLALSHWTLYGQIINYGTSSEWYQRLMDAFSPLGPESEMSEYRVRCHLSTLHLNDPAAVNHALQELREKLKAAKSPRTTPYQKKQWGPTAATKAFKGRVVHPPNLAQSAVPSSSAAAAAAAGAVSGGSSSARPVGGWRAPVASAPVGVGGVGAAGVSPAAPLRPRSAANSGSSVSSAAAASSSRPPPAVHVAPRPSSAASSAQSRCFPPPGHSLRPPLVSGAAGGAGAPAASGSFTCIDVDLTDDALIAALDEAESRLPVHPPPAAALSSAAAPPPRPSMLGISDDALWPVQQHFQRLQSPPANAAVSSFTPHSVMPVREDARMQATHVPLTFSSAAPPPPGAAVAAVVSGPSVPHSTAAAVVPPHALAALNSAAASSAPSAMHADGQGSH